MVLTLQIYGDVWAPDHLKTRIQNNKLKPPMYIRSCGLKPCKDNPANKYHAYDLVIGKRIGGKYVRRRHFIFAFLDTPAADH